MGKPCFLHLDGKAGEHPLLGFRRLTTRVNDLHPQTGSFTPANDCLPFMTYQFDRMHTGQNRFPVLRNIK